MKLNSQKKYEIVMKSDYIKNQTIQNMMEEKKMRTKKQKKVKPTNNIIIGIVLIILSPILFLVSLIIGGMFASVIPFAGVIAGFIMISAIILSPIYFLVKGLIGLMKGE